MELTKKQKVIIFVLSYFVVVIVAELFYRNPLFDASIELEYDIKENVKDDSKTAIFFSFMTEFGSNSFLCFWAFPISVFLPLNHFFLLILTVFTGKFTGNLLKCIYGSPRPTWDNDIDTICNSSFANPSGHSVLATSFFITLWDLISTNYLKSKQLWQIIIKYVYLFISILIILCVMVSRIIALEHTINQVIFGFCVGMGCYLVFFHLLELQNLSGKQFLENIREYIVYIIIVFEVGIIALIIVFLFVRHDKYNSYKAKFIEDCKRIGYTYNNKYFLHYDGLIDTVTISGPIVMIIAMIIVKYVIDKFFHLKDNNIMEWTKNTILHRLIRGILFVAIYIGFHYLNGIVAELISVNNSMSTETILSIVESAFPYFFIFTIGIIFPFFISELILGKQDPLLDTSNVPSLDNIEKNIALVVKD